jgi:hypothetical protein
MHVVEQLGMGMDVAPPGGDFALHGGNTVIDRHRTFFPPTGKDKCSKSQAAAGRQKLKSHDLQCFLNVLSAYPAGTEARAAN